MNKNIFIGDLRKEYSKHGSSAGLDTKSMKTSLITSILENEHDFRVKITSTQENEHDFHVKITSAFVKMHNTRTKYTLTWKTSLVLGAIIISIWAKAFYSAKSHGIRSKKVLDSAKFVNNSAKIHGNSANWKLSSVFSNLTSISTSKK